MKKLETVLRQLSNLYDFNKKIQTYHFRHTNNANMQQPIPPSREERGASAGKVIDPAGCVKQ